MHIFDGEKKEGKNKRMFFVVNNIDGEQKKGIYKTSKRIKRGKKTAKEEAKNEAERVFRKGKAEKKKRTDYKANIFSFYCPTDKASKKEKRSKKRGKAESIRNANQYQFWR